jgi:4-azaleucine resistance transporter AzlC
MWQGMRASLPIALSVVPFGVAYGTVASQHMDYARAMLMSLVVFAGTAQFVTVSMIAQGVAYVPVLITGLLINLRLILLSAALAPHVRRAPTHAQPLLAQLLTDESFAVSIASFRRHGADWLFFAGSGVAIYATWQLS